MSFSTKMTTALAVVATVIASANAELDAKGNAVMECVDVLTDLMVSADPACEIPFAETVGLAICNELHGSPFVDVATIEAIVSDPSAAACFDDLGDLLDDDDVIADLIEGSGNSTVIDVPSNDTIVEVPSNDTVVDGNGTDVAVPRIVEACMEDLEELLLEADQEGCDSVAGLAALAFCAELHAFSSSVVPTISELVENDDMATCVDDLGLLVSDEEVLAGLLDPFGGPSNTTTADPTTTSAPSWPESGDLPRSDGAGPARVGAVLSMALLALWC